MYPDALPNKKSGGDISKHASRVNVPLGIQARLGYIPGVKGLALGSGLVPASLDP